MPTPRPPGGRPAGGVGHLRTDIPSRILRSTDPHSCGPQRRPHRGGGRRVSVSASPLRSLAALVWHVRNWPVPTFLDHTPLLPVDGCYSDFAGPLFAGAHHVDPLEAHRSRVPDDDLKAVKVSGARPSDVVAIFGVGGLGHLALHTPDSPATVVAVDVTEDKLALNGHLTTASRSRPSGARRSGRRIPPPAGPASLRLAANRLVLVGLPSATSCPSRSSRRC